jgi:hypothetical protein
MADLPEDSQSPLGGVYVAVGVLFIALLLGTVSVRRQAVNS